MSDTVYVLVDHEDPQNDGDGRVSLPVGGVFETMQDARQARDHDDNTIFAFGRDEAEQLVSDFEHDVEKRMHGMWCNTCQTMASRGSRYPLDLYDCPNQPAVELDG